MAKLFLLILSLLFGSTSSLFAQDDRKENSEKVEVFQVENIALLNSTEEFGQRAGSARVVAGFIKAIEAEINSLLRASFRKTRLPKTAWLLSRFDLTAPANSGLILEAVFTRASQVNLNRPWQT